MDFVRELNTNLTNLNSEIVQRHTWVQHGAANGNGKIDVSKFVSQDFILSIAIENNPFLCFSISGIIGTQLYYNFGSTLPYDISGNVAYDQTDGTIRLNSAYNNKVDVLAISQIAIYVRQK